MTTSITAIADDVLAALVAGITSLRDRTIILVLAESGLRLGELAMLDRNSITTKSHGLADGKVRMIGRGQAIESKWSGTVRDFFIGPLAVASLIEYLSTVRCDDKETPMFLSTDGKRLDPKAIDRILRKSTDRLGLTPIRAHGFRQGLILRLFNAGSSYSIVKRLLRYSLPATSGEIVPPSQDTLISDYLRAIGSFPWYRTT
jgi:integrase